MALQTYRDLIAWQKSIDLVAEIYRCTDKFPKQEIYGLTSQVRRAAVSIPSNIAEGQGRQHTKEFLNFLGTARGSLMELETHLILSQRVGLLKAPDAEALLNLADEISRMLSGLRRSLEQKDR